MTGAVCLSAWYPGDDVVDQVTISGYNRFGLDQYHTEWESFSKVIGKAYYEIASITERPIGVGETSTPSKGGDKVSHTSLPEYLSLTCMPLFANLCATQCTM